MLKKITFAVLNLLGLSTALYAQIPNPSFENWTNKGTYNLLDNWTTTANFNPTPPFTETKGTGGAPGGGGFYLSIKTINTTSSSGGTTINIGLAGSNKFTTVNGAVGLPYGGFQFTSRPAFLSGYWRYKNNGNDPAVSPGVYCILTKWNTVTAKRDTIAKIEYQMAKANDSVKVWTKFDIPLSYYLSAVPDSAGIQFSSNGNDGNFLDVDNISFTGVYNSIKEAAYTSLLNVYPNPCSKNLIVEVKAQKTEPLTIKLIDITGKTLYNLNAQSNNGVFTQNIDLSSFARGLYFVKIESASMVETKRVSIE